MPDPHPLPVLPILQEGVKASLTMILVNSATSRFVLRVWPTDVLVGAQASTAQPLWAGAVVEERFHQLIWPLTIADVGKDANLPRDQLLEITPDRRLEARTGLIADQSWDGRVLLLQASDP